MAHACAEAIGAVIVNPLLEVADVDGVVRKIDVDRVIQSVQIDAIVQERIDWNQLLIEKIDWNAVIEKIDMNAILERIDLNAVLAKSDTGSLVVQSTCGVAAQVMDTIRAQIIWLDLPVLTQKYVFFWKHMPGGHRNQIEWSTIWW